MKKPLLSIICLFLANFVFAQGTDSTATKKTTKTTTTTVTTIVTAEPIENKRQPKPAKKVKEEEEKDIPTEKRNIIKTSLTSFLISTVHLNYERVINQKVTFQIGAYYTFLSSNGVFDNNNNSNNSDEGKLRGFGITPEIRFYPNGVAPMGFFVAFSPRFQYYVETGTGYNNGGFGSSEVRTAALGTAVIVGRQWLIGDSIALDLYLGPSVNGIISRVETNNQNNYFISQPYASRVGFRFGFSVGFAF